MNIFKGLKFGMRTDSGLPRELLPEVNAFVDIAVGDSRRRESIPIDAIADDTFTTRVLPGLSAGAVADFLYSNPAGRFRFSTVCAGIDARQAHFKIPSTVKMLANYAAKRSAVRIESMLPVQWRFAPDGKGNGSFAKGAMTDLSRSGASLVVGRELRAGACVEIVFSLKSAPEPLALVGEVVRTSKIESSGKSTAGVRFLAVDNADERAINAFIVERQALRRDRGVV